MKQVNWRILRAGFVSTAAAACLSGCFVTPGQFDSELNIQEDGRFIFSYDGEIHFLAMSQLAEMADAAEGKGEDTFSPDDCYDEETYEDRDCTTAELNSQREEWEANAPAREAEEAQGEAMMASMMGGLDPNDPEMAQELAETLESQAGWNSVSYAGDGKFDVEYSIASRIGHDFVFPVMEKVAASTSFVTVSLRDDNRVRVEAAGFSPQSGSNGNPFQSLMMAGMMSGMTGLSTKGDAGSGPTMHQPEGQFRIITNAHILTNNTEEGPTTSAQGQVLTWDINARTTDAPEALIQLTP